MRRAAVAGPRLPAAAAVSRYRAEQCSASQRLLAPASSLRATAPCQIADPTPTPTLTPTFTHLPSPRCGGKLALRDRNWEASAAEFQAAFKAFEEAGNGGKTIMCLKYLLLTTVSVCV